MIFDTLSLVSTLMVVLVIIIIFGAIIYSHFTMKKNLKILARNSILMNADDEIKALCKQIMEIDPNACPLLDGHAANQIKGNAKQLKAVLESHLKKLKS